MATREGRDFAIDTFSSIQTLSDHVAILTTILVWSAFLQLSPLYWLEGYIRAESSASGLRTVVDPFDTFLPSVRMLI
ncbi:hypothetical protein Tdes44962_MAKER05825 [Teratosphaeria destructans]|uniref:Uncharacterized protein n=1 Tax=Teratosphaeria destructans TaxID=418781 RepID=A0A9W7SIY2_9PEZI|nr:hypothetical protein Tdes44962_MAKER05825 [Teratosphaeria destructans]